MDRTKYLNSLKENELVEILFNLDFPCYNNTDTTSTEFDYNVDSYVTIKSKKPSVDRLVGYKTNVIILNDYDILFYDIKNADKLQEYKEKYIDMMISKFGKNYKEDLKKYNKETKEERIKELKNRLFKKKEEVKILENEIQEEENSLQ